MNNLDKNDQSLLITHQSRSPLRKNSTWLIPLVIFLLTFAIYYFTNDGPTPYNNYVRLADAFIHGRLHLNEVVSWMEKVQFEDKNYIIPPPMPAIIILPAVLIFGQNFNQTLASIFFGSVNVALVYIIARRILNNSKSAIWPTILMGFGTIHWWASADGAVWMFAQILAMTFMLLAVNEALTKKRPFVVGLLIGAAYWCRLPTILSLPFFAIIMWDKWVKRDQNKNPIKWIQFSPIARFASGIAIFILLNFIYNYARFGSIFDISYTLMNEAQGLQHGLLNFKHIPKHLEIIFTGLPYFSDTFPYVKPHWWGIAIWFTTPAFIYALFGWKKTKIFISSWLATMAIAIILFSWAFTGYAHFGYRYAIDFYTFLFLLTAAGMGENPAWHAKILIGLSVLVNLWGVVWVYRIGI